MWIRIILAILVIGVIDLFLVLLINKNLRKGSGWRKTLKRLVIGSFIAFSAFSIYIFLTTGTPDIDPVKYRNYFQVTTIFILLYLPKIVILLFLAPSTLLRLAGRKGVFRAAAATLNISGILLGTYLFLSVIHGILYGITNYQTVVVELNDPRIPRDLSGLHLVQFSDAHLGSFSDPEDVLKGLDQIREAEPDILVFTGDMINVAAEELAPYVAYLAALEAPLGKFAILGNHDMADYAKMGEESRSMEENVQMLEAYFRETGFTLLRNQHEIIHFMDDSIAIAGVDNWGLPPFSQHGDLGKALEGIPEGIYTILLSHDPSHWRSQVLPDGRADLTLSGHTHGMQLGIRKPWLTWSPSVFKYPEWIGMHREGDQKMYINPGFGFLGFNGRIGIYPEITLFVLGNQPE